MRAYTARVASGPMPLLPAEQVLVLTPDELALQLQVQSGQFNSLMDGIERELGANPGFPRFNDLPEVQALLASRGSTAALQGQIHAALSLPRASARESALLELLQSQGTLPVAEGDAEHFRSTLHSLFSSLRDPPDPATEARRFFLRVWLSSALNHASGPLGEFLG